VKLTYIVLHHVQEKQLMIMVMAFTAYKVSSCCEQQVELVPISPQR
jgi:hypothetical protein